MSPDTKTWYVVLNGEPNGPFSVEDCQLYIKQGYVRDETLVYGPGLFTWTALKDVPALALAVKSRSAGHVDVILSDLAQMNFSDEVLPVNRDIVRALKGNFVFWSVSCLGIIPLIIATLSGSDSQLTAFALFFAFVWGVVFKRFVLQDTGSWQLPISTLFFTGIVGMVLLVVVYALLPSFYLELARSQNPITSLIGFVFQVGVWEELCKVLPVILYAKWKASKQEPVSPLVLVTMGVFSGLGFAAFENVEYASRSMLRSVALTMEYGSRGAAAGAGEAMVVVMLRALSLVFCHAVWAGIFSYFVAVAASTGKRWGALLIVGLAVSATLHGVYDWLTTTQMTLAALTAGFSFMLFYAYLFKLKTIQATKSEVAERFAEEVWGVGRKGVVSRNSGKVLRTI